MQFRILLKINLFWHLQIILLKWDEVLENNHNYKKQSGRALNIDSFFWFKISNLGWPDPAVFSFDYSSFYKMIFARILVQKIPIWPYRSCKALQEPSRVGSHLRSWEPVLGPAEGSALHVQEGVLLLDPKPRFLIRRLLHRFQTSYSVIGFCSKINKYVQLLII